MFRIVSLLNLCADSFLSKNFGPGDLRQLSFRYADLHANPLAGEDGAARGKRQLQRTVFKFAVEY